MKRALVFSLLLVLMVGVGGCGNAELQKQLDEVTTKLADAEKRIVELEEELKTVTAERDELKAKSEAKATAVKKPVAAKATPTPAPTAETAR